MPDLRTIRAGIAELPKGSPLVVAITGGTTGIGSYVANTLAKIFANNGSKLRVYIIGRNAERAEAVNQYGRETSPGSDWRFLHAKDLSLMSEVDQVSKEVIQMENASPFGGGPPRLDMLYMSQALSPLQASNPTKEGLDTQMSLLYYSRMRFIQALTPLLVAAPNTARVISIFAGGWEDGIKPDENVIGVPSPETYGVTSVRKNVAFMKTFFFEQLAEEHAGNISFIHIYPGLVDGPVFYSEVNPLWFRILWRILKPLFSWYVTSAEDCGAVMVFLSTQRYPTKGSVGPGDKDKVIGGVSYSSQNELGGGAYSVGQRGDESKAVRYAKLRKDDTSKKVWEHTMKTFADIDSKNAS